MKLKGYERDLKAFCKDTRRRNDTFRTQVVGFDRGQSAKAVWAEKRKKEENWLTTTDENGRIDLENFRQALKHGRVNTKIIASQQQKHQNTKAWKNQVKQALQSGGKQTPKSRLFDDVDPQEIVEKFGGNGILDARKNNQCVEEYITLPFDVGVTFDRKLKRYTKTNVVQIKYTKSGVHIFPVQKREG